MSKHLAIMNRFAINAIFAGKKTVETRFSLHRIAPFGQISVGDTVFMKPPGQDIVGLFRVNKVFFYEGLDQDDILKIFTDFNQRISFGDILEDEKFKSSKLNSKFATLIFLDQVERLITSPIKFKKCDQRGWVVLK